MSTAVLLNNDSVALPLSRPAVRAFPRHAESGLTLPVHAWLKAAQWSGIVISAMVVIFLIETYVLHLKGSKLRMVRNPTEVAIRFFGISHYLVATWFLFTSKKLHNLRGICMLGLFSLLAVGACVAFYSLGGHTNFIAVMLVYLFFLMHALRDEVFFYRQRSGQAISDQEYPHVYKMLLWLQAAGLSLLAGVLYPAFIYKFDGSLKHPHFHAWINTLFPTDWPLSLKMLASAVPFLCVTAAALARIETRHEGGVRNLLRSHSPLSVILGGTVALTLSSIFVGTWVLNVVILTHFTGWFLFATAGIAKQPPEIQQAATWRKPNQWIRQNMTGFWVFHGGLAALLFCLIATNHWVFATRPLAINGLTVANPLTLLLNEHNLFYWTIAHCVLGFLPKPAPARR